jgi:flagellar capping protein FliD
MSGKVELGSDVLGLKSVNFDKINGKRLEPFENKKKEIQDKIDLTTDTNEARGELKTIVDSLNKSLSNISSQTNAKFAHVARSSEPAAPGASADDYFDVTASDSSHIGELNVRVIKLATNASASLCKVGNAGFNIANDTFQNDALMITVTTNNIGQAPVTQDIVVDDLAGKSITEVVTKINEQLKAVNVKAEAVLDPTDNGLYNIRITSALTGDRTIAFNCDQQFYLNTNAAPGQNAIVSVNGQIVTSHTNVIKLGKDVAGADIPNHIAQGITLTLKKENTFRDDQGVPLVPQRQPHQTIHIQQDKSIIADKIGEFVDAYNNLKEFIASQEKRNASGTGYEKDAYLARTRELRFAKDLLHSMTDQINVPGLLKSLGSMGILPGENGAGLTINNDRFKDIMDNEFDEIVKFFNSANGFGAKFIGKTGEALQLIDAEVRQVSEKLLKAQAEYEKADAAAQKEQKRIDAEMAKMDIINMELSMTLLFLQGMMSQG